MSIKALELETGVSHSMIQKFEVGGNVVSKSFLKKIARYFNTTVKELDKDIELEKEPIECIAKCKSNPCLNEMCPLNKNKKCVNDLVLSGKAPCFGKDLVKPKEAKLNYRSTNALFLK